MKIRTGQQGEEKEAFERETAVLNRAKRDHKKCMHKCIGSKSMLMSTDKVYSICKLKCKIKGK